jgi:hypothetical protein
MREYECELDVNALFQLPSLALYNTAFIKLSLLA